MLSFSHVQFFPTLWTVALEAPLSMRFSRQEYRSGLSFPFPGYLPDPGIEPRSPALQADFSLNHPSHQGSLHDAETPHQFQGCSQRKEGIAVALTWLVQRCMAQSLNTWDDMAIIHICFSHHADHREALILFPNHTLC